MAATTSMNVDLAAGETDVSVKVALERELEAEARGIRIGADGALMFTDTRQTDGALMFTDTRQTDGALMFTDVGQTDGSLGLADR
jgi:hypothetical protein